MFSPAIANNHLVDRYNSLDQYLSVSGELYIYQFLKPSYPKSHFFQSSHQWVEGFILLSYRYYASCLQIRREGLLFDTWNVFFSFPKMKTSLMAEYEWQESWWLRCSFLEYLICLHSLACQPFLSSPIAAWLNGSQFKSRAEWHCWYFIEVLREFRILTNAFFPRGWLYFGGYFLACWFEGYHFIADQVQSSTTESWSFLRLRRRVRSSVGRLLFESSALYRLKRHSDSKGLGFT